MITASRLIVCITRSKVSAGCRFSTARARTFRPRAKVALMSVLSSGHRSSIKSSSRAKNCAGVRQPATRSRDRTNKKPAPRHHNLRRRQVLWKDFDIPLEQRGAFIEACCRLRQYFFEDLRLSERKHANSTTLERPTARLEYLRPSHRGPRTSYTCQHYRGISFSRHKADTSSRTGL